MIRFSFCWGHQSGLGRHIEASSTFETWCSVLLPFVLRSSYDGGRYGFGPALFFRYLGESIASPSELFSRFIFLFVSTGKPSPPGSNTHTVTVGCAQQIMDR